MRFAPSFAGESSAVVFHFPCLDGTAAAWVALHSFARDAVMFPCSPGGPPPDVSGFDLVFVVDISFPADVMRSWAGTNGKVIVLDHHVSAAKGLTGTGLLAGLGSSLRRLVDPGFSGISVSVVDDRSGAGLAALAASASGQADVVPELVWDVEDKDLWRWSIPGSRAVCAAVGSQLEGLGVDAALSEFGRLSRVRRALLLSRGAVLLGEQDRKVEGMVDGARFMVVAGYRVPYVVAEGPGLGSAVGEALLRRFPDAPFAAFVSGSGPFRVSLRSEDVRCDVSEVAQSFGGGGHRNAAGFACVSLSSLAGSAEESDEGHG